MGLGTNIVLGMILALLILLVISLIHDAINKKRNPHLGYNFIAGLGYGYKENEPRVIEISDKLKLHFSYQYFPMVEVYAKNRFGEFSMVEDKIFGFRSVGKSIRFEQPWREEISEHLKTLCSEMKEEERRKEKEEQDQIEAIKNNWNK